MINPSDWVDNGVLGDAKSPDVTWQAIKIFGTRISPSISLKEATEVLKTLRVAFVFWNGTVPENTAIEVYAKLDTESAWHRFNKSGDSFPSINESLKNPEERSVQFKIVLRSSVIETNPTLSPEFTWLLLVIYNNDELSWQADNLIQLTWKEE